MILTMCYDPILESKYYVDKLLPKSESLAKKKIYNISGDGILTSRILNNLNVEVSTAGFSGGLEGQHIINRLNELDIHNDFIPIKDDSKSSIIIYQDDYLLTTIIEESPRITREEMSSFYESYGEIIDRYSIICGLGDLPIGMPEDIYFDLISLAKKNDKKFLLEAKGEELKYGIEANPLLVKLTKKDLEYLSYLRLEFENEIIKVGYSIVEKGIELVCIDLNDKGSIILTKDKGYRLELDDSYNLRKDKGYMLAGFAFGLYKNYDLETILRFAQATRMVYAMESDLDRIDMSDIKRFMTKIDIYPFNY